MNTSTFFLLLASITPILSSRILHVAVINASSHHMWHNLIATELAQRGHEVTYVAAQHMKTSLRPDIKVLVNQQSEESIKSWEDTFFITEDATSVERLYRLQASMITDCKSMFDVGAFKGLIDPSNNDTYDLILMEYAGHDCLLPLSQRFGDIPVILINPVTSNPFWLLRAAGAPVFHLNPFLAEELRPSNGILDRLNSLRLYLLDDYNYYWNARPVMEEFNRRNFGDNVMSVKKLIEKVSLFIPNLPDWAIKVPLTSNVIPVAGIHLTEAKALKADLKEFMDGADDGVILISFGTLMPTKDLAQDNLRMIATALGKLPQRVLWKWDPHMKADNIVFPKNIWRLSWVPQNDILGHPKLRLFVSHCGGQSILEAMYHGVPVLGVPGFWDQNENTNRLVDEGAALRLNFRDISEETLLKTVRELISNPKYTEGALRLKNVLRDQPVKPLDRMIFWIEYVIRHGGAPHLRPLLRDMPYNNILMFDIVIVTLASVILIVVSSKTLFWLLRACRTVCVKEPKNKSD